jgi:hypothetical protein
MVLSVQKKSQHDCEQVWIMELKGVWDGVIVSDGKVVVEGKVTMCSRQRPKKINTDK